MKQNPAKRKTKTSKKAVKKTPVTPAFTQQSVLVKQSSVIIVTDQKFYIKNWCKEAQLLLGWSAQEAVGKQPEKLLKFAYPSSTNIAAVHKKIKLTGSFNCSAILKSKDKKNLNVQVIITSLTNKSGTLTGAVYLINLLNKKPAIKRNNETFIPALSNVFERVTDAFVAFDNDWRYTFVNKKATELLGKSKKQLIGKNVWEVFPDGIDQPFYKALHKAKKTQKPSHLELYYAPFDRWYEDHIYPSANGISVYYHDITEKKKAAFLLKESEEKYKGLIEQASDAVIIYSLDGTIYDFNKSAYEQTGYSKKEFQKLRLSDLLNNEEIVLNPAFAESFKTGKAVLFERKLKLKDGSLVDVELNVRMLPDGKLLGFARNITDRKKALNDLKESEIRFRSLFEHASDGIYIADPEGKYVEVNESGCKMVGYTKEEIAKLSLFDLVVMENDSIPLRIDEIKAGKHVIQQRQLKKKDGNILQVEISSKLLPDGRMLGMVRDITERLEIKNRLRKEKELSEKIINSLPGIFYLSDQTPSLIIWNKMFETLSGYSAGELKTMRPIHLFVTEDQPAVLQSLQKTYTTGAADVEARLLTKSGEQIPFYFTGVRIEYNGKLCMLGTGINLTERKKAEEKIITTEKRYKALIENSTDGLTVIDINGTVVDMSPSGKKILGYDANEIIGNIRPDLIHPNDQELHFTAFAEIIKDPSKVKQFEYRHKMPDGRYKWLECSYSNLLNEPSIGAIVLNYRDISERKTAVNQILREKILSESIINSLPGIFYMYDKEGHFIKWNENFELLTGYKKAEISKMHPIDFYDANLKEIIISRIDTIFKNKKTGGIELDLLTKTKQKIPLFINSMIIDYEGKPCLIGLGLDLSESKKAEEEIRKSYERFELLGKATKDGLWDWNLETNQVWGNEMHQQLYGLTISDPVPSFEEWKKRIHPDDREQTVKAFNDALSSKRKNYSSEYRFKANTGGWINLYGRTLIERNKDDKPIRLIGSMIDVTENKKAEEALSASENRLRAIYETEPECIKMLNEKGELMEMNAAGLEMIEADSLETVKGKQVHGIVDKEYKKAFIQLTENVFKNIPGKLEFRITGFKGGKRWLETNAVPFKDKNGNIISLLGITREITERKKAEDDIKQMIERFQLIAKATNDAVWDWDFENNIIWWSDVFYEKFGFDKSQPASNKLFKSNVFIDDREKTEKSFNTALEEKASSWTAEFRFLTKEGNLLTLSDKAFFLKNKEGNIYRVIGAMQDVTRQKEDEKRISKATLDAQENERTQIGLELHDNINQILVGALLNLAMTSKVSVDKKQDIIEKVKSYIQSSISEIRKVSHRLAPVSFEDGTLKEAFEALLEDMNIENKFNIQLHVDEFDKNKVSGDIQKNLYRILQEQLNNILKYSKANFIEIEITNSNDKIKMKIYDNGIGFNPNEIRKGIGLNNIKKRAEAFSGNFHLNTSPGSGCKLEIEIPLNNH